MNSDSTIVKSDFHKLNDQIAAQPENAALYYERARIFMQKNNIKQAYDDITKAVSFDSTKQEYYLFLAEVSFKGLLIQKSLDAFNKAIALDPGNIEAHLKLSELLLYIKAYDNCLKEADEALKIDKNISKAYFIKGFAFKETGDTSKALSSFQTCVEIDPSNYDAYIQLGNIETSRKHKIALQYYNNALRIRPASTEALYNRGLLYQYQGILEKAEEDYYNILKIDPAYSSAHFNLGYIDVAYKTNYPSAIAHFTDAIRSNKNYVEAFYNRGVAYELSGDVKSAIVDYREAVNIVPTYKLAIEKLQKLSPGDLKK
jgi:tetratricopeptide (TPR) repeat protein